MDMRRDSWKQQERGGFIANALGLLQRSMSTFSFNFFASKQEVIFPDDKIKQYKGLCRRALISSWRPFFLCVCVSPVHGVLYMSVEEARCVALLTAFVPARLRQQFGVVPGRWFLPYCYNSM